MALDAALRFAGAQQPRFVDELKAFVALPSVSAQPRHAADVRRCADWLARHLRGIGLPDARSVPTAGHPLVLASWRGAPGAPTLLVYGHHDVQPAEPLAAWHSPPFVPTVRGEALYGRGSSDDKGQLFILVKAIESWLATARRLPVNLVCLFEGEEEIGSPHLMPFVRAHRDALACDAVLMADSALARPGQPALMHGMRGALYLELQVDGPPHDLHAGNFGGIVHNPVQALCELIAGLHDAQGRIAIPGFHGRVRRWRAAERALLARDGPTDAGLMHDAGIDTPWGERDWSLYERLALRPALTVNGIHGGYTGPGSKGVIPARASAKLSLRLVPDQDPREIAQLLRRHVAAVAPPTVRVRLRTLSGAKPFLMDPRHPALRAAVAACRQAFGVAPAMLRGGGTIPALHGFQAELGAPTIALGFAPNDGARHGPDEKLHLPTFERAVAAVIALFGELGGELGRAPAGAPRWRAAEPLQAA
ncbi:dipeptidase [Rhizobacter sp. P5_C2]